MADDLCPHRVPRASFCKRCDQEKAAKQSKAVAKTKPAGRLAELERVVERGLQTFVEVGRALAEIRDSGLYRETHGTFEAYLDERWDLSKTHGYDLIRAAQVAELVSGIPDTPPPRTASQAGALVPLRDRPEEARAAWKEASADGKPTAAKTRAAANKRIARDDVRPAPAELVCVPRDLLVRAADGLRVVGSAEVDQDALGALADELAEATA